MQTHSAFPSLSSQSLIIRGFESHSSKAHTQKDPFEHVRSRIGDDLAQTLPYEETKDATESQEGKTEGAKEGRLAEDTYQPSLPVETHNSSPVSSAMSFHGLEQRVSKAAEIQIETQEGDVITISFKSLEESSRTAFQMNQGGSEIRAYSENESFELDFNMSIEGDLNDKEKKSIDQLMKKMGKVSKEFFQGDINNAFKHAQKIGFNSNQISGFSMDLNMEQSVQAVAAYKQTSLPEQDVNPDLLGQAAEFLTEVKNFMNDSAAALESLAAPKQSFSDLFSGIGQLYSGTENQQSESPSLFSDMVEHLANEQFTQDIAENQLEPIEEEIS